MSVKKCCLYVNKCKSKISSITPLCGVIGTYLCAKVCAKISVFSIESNVAAKNDPFHCCHEIKTYCQADVVPLLMFGVSAFGLP